MVTWCTTSLTFNNCTLCPHCIYVFCIYLRTNSHLCHLQYKLICLYFVGWSVTLTPHPLLVPWSWKSRAIPLLPLWAVRPAHSLNACTRVHFTFTFTPVTFTSSKFGNTKLVSVSFHFPTLSMQKICVTSSGRVPGRANLNFLQRHFVF
jgi:hypothetical protein